jgi:Tfp pilus assembly protein FimT
MADINLDRIAQLLNFKDSNIQMRHSRSKSVDQQHIPSDFDKNWSNKVLCWLLITYNGKELAKKVTINHKMQSLNAYIHEQVQSVLHDSYQQTSISFSKIRVTTDGYEISMDQDVPISDYANIKDQIHLEVMLE